MHASLESKVRQEKQVGRLAVVAAEKDQRKRPALQKQLEIKAKNKGVR